MGGLSRGAGMGMAPHHYAHTGRGMGALAPHRMCVWGGGGLPAGLCAMPYTFRVLTVLLPLSAWQWKSQHGIACGSQGNSSVAQSPSCSPLLPRSFLSLGWPAPSPWQGWHKRPWPLPPPGPFQAGLGLSRGTRGLLLLHAPWRSHGGHMPP